MTLNDFRLITTISRYRHVTATRIYTIEVRLRMQLVSSYTRLLQFLYSTISNKGNKNEGEE